MADNTPPANDSIVTEPVTTDAIARFELDDVGEHPTPLSIEVDVPRDVVDELEDMVADTDGNATLRDFLLEQVDIDLRFTSDGEPVDDEQTPTVE